MFVMSNLNSLVKVISSNVLLVEHLETKLTVYEIEFCPLLVLRNLILAKVLQYVDDVVVWIY